MLDRQKKLVCLLPVHCSEHYGYMHITLTLIAAILVIYYCSIFMLLHVDPPSAIITPPSVTVSEGEEARFTCDAQGSGALTVTWSLSNGSPLPVGVQENGNSIYIASATSSHPGTYVCSVSNLAGTAQAEATLTVYCE